MITLTLIFSFYSSTASLFTLVYMLEAMENRLDVPVDRVQEPLPEDALFEIEERAPLYEAV